MIGWKQTAKSTHTHIRTYIKNKSDNKYACNNSKWPVVTPAWPLEMCFFCCRCPLSLLSYVCILLFHQIVLNRVFESRTNEMVNNTHWLHPINTHTNTSFIQFLFGFALEINDHFFSCCYCCHCFFNVYFPLQNFKFIFALSFGEFIHKFWAVFVDVFLSNIDSSTMTSYVRTTTMK